jgi:hypothetical protein
MDRSLMLRSTNPPPVAISCTQATRLTISPAKLAWQLLYAVLVLLYLLMLAGCLSTHGGEGRILESWRNEHIEQVFRHWGSLNGRQSSLMAVPFMSGVTRNR